MRSYKSLVIIASILICMIGAALTVLLHVHAAQDSIDNLKLQPGTKTAKMGTLGKAIKVGSGKQHVVVLAGAPFDGEVWRPFMERHKDEYTFHALTPAGYGGTAPPPMPQTQNFEEPIWTEGFLKAVEKYIDKNKVRNPILMGHHLMADNYVIMLASRQPNKYRRIFITFGTHSMSLQQPGSTKPLDTEDRIKLVKQQSSRMYQRVTQETWNQGTFQASVLSSNAEIGEKMYKAEIAVPIPVQLRYFLEYGCWDISETVKKLKTPMYILDKPARSFDQLYQTSLDQAIKQIGDKDKARTALDNQLKQMFESVEKARATFEAPSWKPWCEGLDHVTVRLPKFQSVFAFLDAPKEFDKEFARFMSSLKD